MLNCEKVICITLMITYVSWMQNIHVNIQLFESLFHICLVNIYCWREAGSQLTGDRPYLIVFNKNVQQIWKCFALQQTANVKEANATAADNNKVMKRQRDYPDSLVKLHHFVSCWIRRKGLKVVKSCGICYSLSCLVNPANVIPVCHCQKRLQSAMYFKHLSDTPLSCNIRIHDQRLF